MRKPKRKFLKLPEFPGGKEAFSEYIKKNLVYPEKALQNGVEGTVLLNAEIDDNGNVLDVTIEKSVGSGCDQEAERLIKKVKFGKVKNRGRRVKTRKKFKIPFRLPDQKKINYNVSNEKTADGTENKPTKKYTYQIKI